MFERFTDSARRVIVEAEKEAKKLNYGFIGAENLLFGIIKMESEGDAPPILAALGVTPELYLEEWMKLLNMSEGVEEFQKVESGRLPLTPRAKKVIELSLREALALAHNYVAVEHVLLASMRESEGIGVKVLVKLGVDPAAVREMTLQSFNPDGTSDPLKRLGLYLQQAMTQTRFLKERLPQDDTLKRIELERIESDLEKAEKRLEDLKKEG